jgi:cytochrome c biogenesis protein CcmG, thiol:disulfide interchange protein DsbE
MSAISEPTESAAVDAPGEPAESPVASTPETPGRPGLMRRLAGVAWRHKVLSGITAAFIIAIPIVSVATTGSSAPSNSLSADGAGAIIRDAGKASSFTLPELGDSAKQVSLAQYAGKPVIVNFFASWCPPCQQETPLLASWYKQQDGKVVLLGLDENDSTAKAEAFVAAKGVTYPVGFDPNTIAASGYNVVELPQTFFLNAQHHIVDHVYGALTQAELAQGVSLMNSAS